VRGTAGSFARVGLPEREAERGLLLLADHPAAFDAMQPLVDALAKRDSRINLLSASAVAATAKWLQSHLAGVRQVPLPYGNRVSGDLYLRRLNIRTVVFLDPARATASSALLRSLKRQAISMITLTASDAGGLESDAPAVRDSEQVILIDEAAANGASGAMTYAATADFLAALMARDLKPLRQERSPLAAPARALAGMTRSAKNRPMIDWRFRRFATLADLKRRLGHPATILCLGNGPSSEDPALAAIAHDALFRVNHSWQARQRFSRPQVVFTGGRPTMRAVAGAIFGLQSLEAEVRLASARGLNPMVGATEFFNVNDLTDSIRRFDWGHLRPTNGASMLAAAVALSPQRLVIAGIDLFQHPDGSYPWAASGPNAYSPGHSRETELEFILGLLSQYEGEVMIVGDILARAWQGLGEVPGT
jgi:hypothetical protein